MGLGFGLSGAPLNAYPPHFFPGRDHSAVVALHTVLGAGLALGPLAMGPLVSGGMWLAFPLELLVLCVLLALLAGMAGLPERLGAEENETGSSGHRCATPPSGCSPGRLCPCSGRRWWAGAC